MSKIMPPAHPFDSSYLRDADDGDKLKEECGVFGVIGVADASNFVALGLHALQHRGQESAGIATVHDGSVLLRRAMGYVGDAFDDQMLAELKGSASIGHVRYSTFGDSRIVNAQPILIDCAHGQIALCHNCLLYTSDAADE